MIAGRLLAEPILKRTVMGITHDGRILWDNPSFKANITVSDSTDTSVRHEIPIHGVNRKRRSRKETIIYTKEYKNTTPANPMVVEITVAGGLIAFVGSGGKSSIPQTDNDYVISLRETVSILDGIKLGDRATLHLNLKDEWKDVVHAVGGGPRLVRDGQKVEPDNNTPSFKDEGFQEDVSQGLAPRSAVGVTVDGAMLFVVVDGRQTTSPGISLSALAELMMELGAVEAMNLDGGGSSTLVYKGQVMNRPSDGFERSVSVALVFIAP